MTASAEKDKLTGLWFIGQKHYPDKTGGWIHDPDHAVFESVRLWLSDYFSGRFRIHDIQIDPHGTEFQKTVWNIIMEIPFGCTLTYSEIAKKISCARKSSFRSARAVGGAVAHNPVSILVPCHRVVGADRSLTGYAGGIERKKALLETENNQLFAKPSNLI